MGNFPKTTLALISSGADVNEMDINDMSPLHWACARGNGDTIAALLSNPQLNPNLGAPGVNRPIHLALEWLTRRAEGTTLINLPLMLLKDQRIDVNATGVSRKDTISPIRLY